MDAAQQAALAAKRPEQRRLKGSPIDFSRFRPGQSIAAFLGNCWSPAQVEKVSADHLIVTGRRLGSNDTTTFAIRDARNASNTAELRALAKEHARIRKQELAAAFEQQDIEGNL
jgi:hypothetical protein